MYDCNTFRNMPHIKQVDNMRLIVFHVAFDLTVSISHKM